jgi:hypothetical protein
MPWLYRVSRRRSGAAVDRSAERPGASVSKQTIRRVADGVVEEMQSWQAWPLEEVQLNHYRRRALSVGTTD